MDQDCNLKMKTFATFLLHVLLLQKKGVRHRRQPGNLVWTFQALPKMFLV